MAARKPKKDDITVVGFVILEEGRAVPMDELTPEQLESWHTACRERLSERLSSYYSRHPEEYARL